MLLLLFTVAQLSVVHEFSHDDHEQECAICIVAHDFQSQSFDLSSPVDFQVLEITPFTESIVVDIVFAKTDSQPTIHTTRPPPYTILIS